MRLLPFRGRLEDRVSGDSAIERYRSLWDDREPSLEQFWAGIAPTHSISVLGTLVKIDLENRFNRGERPSVAEYLERLPALTESSDRVVSLIYEEFCLLEERGEDPDSARFCEKYEPWRDSLKSQLGYHRELSRAVGVEAAPTRYPRLGERFARFHLRSILGTGGAARVYLATQDELGDRKVALKVSASIGREPSILAHLDHRNIVPILMVTEAEDGLRAFCMPYRPGLTLEKLIKRLGSTTVPGSSKAVWEALQPAGGEEIEGFGDDRPGWSGFPRSGTYPEAVAWIGLSLAQALAYLHAKGVLHRDIKPANILLAYREGPQLLDFNLAHAPSDPEHAKAALKGGTLPFMAPEQLRAFLDPADWEKVDAPADLYALGLVLRVLLTGQAPDVPDSRLPLTRAIQALHDRRSRPVAPVRRLNPGVPPSLESIVAKCLEFDPPRRYEGASDLAEDLRRFLAREHLKFAENTSIVERGVNRLYRNRLLVGAISLMSLVAALFLLIPRLLPAESFLEKEFSRAELRDYDRAVAELASRDPVAWQRARETFRRLGIAHPDLAWPLLYETVTLEKLSSQPGGLPLLAEANAKLTEAVKMRDYAIAMKHRFDEDPRSVTLLVKQAQQVLVNPSDVEALTKARDLLRTAVGINPRRVDALALLAQVEQRCDRPEEAIRYFRQAVDVATATPIGLVVPLALCRGRLLFLLTHKADDLTNPDRPFSDREAASSLYHQVEEILENLVDDWRAGKPSTTPETIEYFQEFYRGAIASGRAALAGEAGDDMTAELLLEEASRGFDLASALAARYPTSLDTNMENVGTARQLMEERSRRFLVSR